MSFKEFLEFKDKQKELMKLQDECDKNVSIIKKFVDKKEVVKDFLYNEIVEFKKRRDCLYNLRNSIRSRRGIISKMFIPQIQKNNLEIEQLKRTFQTEAVSLFCLYKYSSVYQTDYVSSEVFSNTLISSKLISLLFNEETNIEVFGSTLISSLKRIDKLRKNNTNLEQLINKYLQKISEIEEKIKLLEPDEYNFNRERLCEILGVDKSYFKDLNQIPEKVIYNGPYSRNGCWCTIIEAVNNFIYYLTHNYFDTLFHSSERYIELFKQWVRFSRTSFQKAIDKELFLRNYDIYCKYRSYTLEISLRQ